MIDLLSGDMINLVLSFVGAILLIYGGLKAISKGMKRSLVPLVIGIALIMSAGTSGFDLIFSFFN